MTTMPGVLRLPNRAVLAPWGLVLTGLLALYLPTFTDLLDGAWATEKNAHGPIVMAVAFAYLFCRMRQMRAEGLLECRPQPLVGGLMFVFGLLCYVLGRSQSVLILEVGSLIPVLSAIVVTTFGLRSWSRAWFAFFFMLFMIPLPATIVDALTLPMKISVSYITEHLLYWLGYPIARSGVILSIGQYQLLVADACAGLNSLFTLEALGLLYMNLVRHHSVVRNTVLAMLIVPVSFAANTLRIVFLALITYHMGDAAGQGFLHGLSSLVLFLSALLLIIGVDSLLAWLVGSPRLGLEAGKGPSSDAVASRRRMGRIGTRASAAMLSAMLFAPVLAKAWTPTLEERATAARLEESLPRQFGEWHAIPGDISQAELSVAADGRKSDDQPYDDVLMRTYVNQSGEKIMLAVAYAREQRQDVKLHLPEGCYPAQGYKVLALTPVALRVGADGTRLPGKHMLASGHGRLEAVTYWTRISDAYPQGGLAMRIKIFLDGLHGIVSDGVLVRSSMIVADAADAANAHAVQEDFLRALVAAGRPQTRVLVVEYANARP